MLKANQAQVIQTANINMVNLRNAEINYFSNFFTSFGTQAALISGICVNSVSQVPGIGCPCSPFWTYLYWITTALCLVSAMHVLLCSVYISVYGQGLALRGPLGSMARAVDGMIIEQEQVVTTFCFSLFCLALSLIGTYGIMMTLTGALITSALTIIGMILWYHYSLRIYNRFYFETRGEWNEEDDALDQQFPDPDAYAKGVQAKLHNNAASESANKKQGFFGGSIFNRKPNASATTTTSSSNAATLSSSKATVIGSVQPENIERTPALHSSELICGYLSIKESKMMSKSWIRRYVVLKGSYLVCYNNKMEFETKPNQPINKRAINFAGFDVNVEISEEAYCVLLSPSADDDETLKSWEFRCDTPAELETWKTAFENAATGGAVQPTVDPVPKGSKSVFGGTQA